MWVSAVVISVGSYGQLWLTYFLKGFNGLPWKDLWRVVPISWWDSQAYWMAHLRISHAPWRFPLLSWGFHVFLWGVPRFIKGFPEGLHWMTWGFPWTYPRASWRISLISLSIYMELPISHLKPLQISSRTHPDGLHLFSLRTFIRGAQGFLWFPRWVHRFTEVLS